MKTKMIAISCIVLAAIMLFTGCENNEATSDSRKSDTGITEMRFATLMSPVEIDAKDEKTGYFSVEGNEEFSIDDIEFKSTDESVVTFVYDKTALKTCVYYKITGVSEGSAEIYAQTKDGVVSTEKISVTVCGYSYEVVSIDDISVGNTRRHNIKAIVAESLVEGKTDDEIRDIMEFIITKYADRHKLNSISVGLYIEGDNTNEGYTVGGLTYAPYGDISRASEVEAGDYASFEFCDAVVYSETVRNTMRGK